MKSPVTAGIRQVSEACAEKFDDVYANVARLEGKAG
jgi:hypothetical protein